MILIQGDLLFYESNSTVLVVIQCHHNCSGLPQTLMPVGMVILAKAMQKLAPSMSIIYVGDWSGQNLVHVVTPNRELSGHGLFKFLPVSVADPGSGERGTCLALYIKFMVNFNDFSNLKFHGQFQDCKY
jgi:hypothetical protein